MTTASSARTPSTAASHEGVGREHEAELYLTACAPFVWDHSLRFICGFPATQGEQAIEGGRLLKAWRLLDRSVVTRIGAGVAQQGPGLHVALVSPDPITEAVRDAVADRLRFYLSLDDDLSGLARTAAADPAFAAVAGRLHGYHQVKFATPVENVVWAILAQRTPMPVAREAKLRLMRHLNAPVTAFGRELLPFPSLPQLAALSLEDFADITGNRRKAGYLYGSVQKLEQVEESFLREGEHDDVERFLLSLPGIGPWSATFVMIRGLGRMERLPDDAALVEAAQRAYRRPLSASDLVALSAPYAPHQGYWAHYLRVAQ